LVTAIGVLVANAVAAVLAGCALYGIEYLYRRYIAPESGMQGIPSVAE
jgi:hypothetical protein